MVESSFREFDTRTRTRQRTLPRHRSSPDPVQSAHWHGAVAPLKHMLGRQAAGASDSTCLALPRRIRSSPRATPESYSNGVTELTTTASFCMRLHACSLGRNVTDALQTKCRVLPSSCRCTPCPRRAGMTSTSYGPPGLLAVSCTHLGISSCAAHALDESQQFLVTTSLLQVWRT